LGIVELLVSGMFELNIVDLEFRVGLDDDFGLIVER
jgi:hypothetical protein